MLSPNFHQLQSQAYATAKAMVVVSVEEMMAVVNEGEATGNEPQVANLDKQSTRTNHGHPAVAASLSTQAYTEPQYVARALNN